MHNAGTNPSRVLQYSIDARPEPRLSSFDCGHNFRIGAADKGMEDSIIKTRGDGIVLPWTMPALIWIHRVTSGYTGLHMDTQGYKWIHRVTYGYTG